MGPKDTSERVSDMFRQPLIELLNPRHELVKGPMTTPTAGG